MSVSSTTSYARDFYEAVNCKWLADPLNSIPPEYSRWGSFEKLHDESLKNQITLVEELNAKIQLDPSCASITDSDRKIAAIWAASNTRFKSWDDGTATCAPISEELHKMRSMLKEHSIHGIASYLHYTQVNGISNVFDFDKESDFENTENVVLDLKACGMSLPSRDYYLDPKFEDKRALFVSHLQNVRHIINTASGNENYIDDTFAQDVLSFETDIAKLSMTPTQSRQYTEYYTSTTLTDLIVNPNSLRSLKDKEDNYTDGDKTFELDAETLDKGADFWSMVYKLFNFRSVLEANRRKFYTDPATKEIRPDAPHIEQLYCYDGDAIRRMLSLVLDPSNFTRYRAFLEYSIIKSYKAFATKDLDDEFFDFYSTKMTGIVSQKPNNKRSIDLINAFASDLMGQVYVARFFPPSNKTAIRGLITRVIESMRRSIQSNDWFELTTKEKALEKLSMFSVKVGYPDVLKDYSDLDIQFGDSLYTINKKVSAWSLQHEFFDRINAPKDNNEWLMAPQVINAYFHPLHNEIVFPAAILQPPFFHMTESTIDFDYLDDDGLDQDQSTINTDLLVYAANCGGICAVIAHEITHGYDDQGRKFDGKGNNVDWWTAKDADVFNAKSNLMKIQASAYTVTINDQVYNQNADLTMGENLADLGGLSLGMSTLNAELETNGVVKGSPMSKFYHRVFFKSFANIWKQKIKTEHEIKLITTDPHAPAKFRANLVSNIDEFYDSFNVKEGDRMFIQKSDRLVMW